MSVRVKHSSFHSAVQCMTHGCSKQGSAKLMQGSPACVTPAGHSRGLHASNEQQAGLEGGVTSFAREESAFSKANLQCAYLQSTSHH
jgi:hypothetical protein